MEATLSVCSLEIKIRSFSSGPQISSFSKTFWVITTQCLSRSKITVREKKFSNYGKILESFFDQTYVDKFFCHKTCDFITGQFESVEVPTESAINLF